MGRFAKRLQRVKSDSSTLPSGQLYGWQITTSNVGLAGVGINKSNLPLYTGPSEVPRGTTISNKKITVPLDLYNGDITIDRCWIAPTSFGSPTFALVSTIRYVNNNNTQSPVGNNLIQDCEIDATQLPLSSELGNCPAFAGIATMKRTYIHGMGTGLAVIVTGPTLSGLFENNYVTGLRGFGDPATTGSHNEGGTIRDFPRSAGRTCKFINNRLDCSTVQNDTGGLFFQPLWDEIWNVEVRGNYLEGGGYNLYLEPNANGYGNMTAMNNRFRPTGYGASAVTGGPGWVAFDENYIYDSAQADGKGAPVQA